MGDITPFQVLFSIYNQQVKETTKSFYLTKMGILQQMCLAFEFEIKDHSIMINGEQIKRPSEYLLKKSEEIKLYELQFLYDKDCNKNLDKIYPILPDYDNGYNPPQEYIKNPLKLRHVVKRLYDFLILMNNISSELIKKYDNFTLTAEEDYSVNEKDFIKLDGEDNNVF